MFTIISIFLFFAFIAGILYYANKADKENNEEAKELNAISGGNYRLKGPEIDKFRVAYPDWDNLTKFKKSEIVKEHYMS